MGKLDWNRFEEAFANRARRMIAKVVRDHPDHQFYALALYESYRELDGQITLPWAAVNSLESLQASKDGEQDVAKYLPPDWKWNEIEVRTKEIDNFTVALQEEANRSTQAHWYRTEKRFLAVMVRVVKRLYAAFKDHPQMTDDFIVYFDDESHGEELLRKCLSKRLFLKHFGTLARREAGRQQVENLPLKSSKLATYLTDIYGYEDELVALGEPAIDALITRLKDEEDGHTAARILGRIGIQNVKAIRALRREVRRSGAAAGWCAGALGMLGDFKWLHAETDNEASRADAVGGIVFPLRSWANQAAKPIPLDYRALERLLSKGCRKCSAIAAKELAPGHGECRITVADIDEAIRGLQSRYLVIRQHAVCVLGERGLGKAAAKRVLPALVEAFQEIDWSKQLPVTDDFIVLCTDYVGYWFDEDFEACVPKDKRDLLMSKDHKPF